MVLSASTAFGRASALILAPGADRVALPGLLDQAEALRRSAEAANLARLSQIAPRADATASTAETARLRAEAERYQVALDRLIGREGTGGAPDARLTLGGAEDPGALARATGADDAWLRVGPDGAVAVQAGRGDDALNLSAEVIDGVAMRAGDDVATLEGRIIRNILMDAEGEHGSYHGEKPSAGADALALRADLVQSVSLGAGDDALAVVADLAYGIEGGAGDDRITADLGIVGGIGGGDGDDVLVIRAAMGAGAARLLSDPSLRVGPGGEAQAAPAGPVAGGPVAGGPVAGGAVSSAVAARLAEGLNGTGGWWADVSGGAGADRISVSGGGMVAVAGGEGDDRIALADGLTTLTHFRGDGHDVVTLGAGASVFLDLRGGTERQDWSVTRDGDRLRVTLDGGAASVTFEGVGPGNRIAIGLIGHAARMLHPEG